MSEQKYRLEENNQTNELILWEDVKILNVFKNSYDNRKHLNIIVDRLNEQQFTIEQLQKENKRLKERNDELEDELEESSAFIIEQREENKQLKEQVQILKKEVRDFLHLCDVCDIQSHLSDECEEVLNDE